jgi:hypothetical protein
MKIEEVLVSVPSVNFDENTVQEYLFLKRQTPWPLVSKPTIPTDEIFLMDAVFWDVARRNIPEDGILHSHRRENLKSYMKYF